MTKLLLSAVLALAACAGCTSHDPADGPTGDSHQSNTADRSESPETNLQNNTGNDVDQDPDAAANEHSVPRTYCMADGSGWRVFVWSRKEWSPSVVKDTGTCPVKP